MDIFTGDAGFIGKVADIIIDMEQGEVVRITTEPLKNISRENATRILKEKSILYRKVTSVRDIMIVGKSPEMPQPKPEAPKPETRRSSLRPSARDMLKK